MLSGKAEMVGILSPQKHLGQMYRMRQAQGKDMPFALLLGTDPAVPFISGTPQDDRVQEATILGAYFGEPIQLVRCQTVDLDIPNSAEIVLEGMVTWNMAEMKGPFAEYQGLLHPGARTVKPIYRVSAMCFRDNPILPVVASGFPPEENHTVWGLGVAATIKKHLLDAGLPVKDVCAPVEAAQHWVVVSVALAEHWPHVTEKPWSQLAREIGQVAFASRGGTVTPKVIVVDDRIDITDLTRVAWALATQNHPGPRGYIEFPQSPANPLNEFLHSDEKLVRWTTKAVCNCLPPDERLKKDMPVIADFIMFPEEIRNRVLTHWEGDGYGPLDGSTERNFLAAQGKLTGIANAAAVPHD
jgi:4-hydroxy-3-polyprenylbenzoate decarboxylase